MPRRPPIPTPVPARALSILAAGVARLVGGAGDCRESSGDGLEPPEHAAITHPASERGARGEKDGGHGPEDEHV